MGFHKNFARTQAEAEQIAELFNRGLGGPDSWEMHFLPCHVYELHDVDYHQSKAWVLAEPELEGKYTKWNNNGGAVLRARGIRTDCHASAAPSHANPEALKHARALSSLTGRARAEGQSPL